MIDDMEIRRNNVAMPVEVWGNTSFDEKVMWLMRSPPFRTLPSANKQRETAGYNHTLEQQVVERTAVASL